MQPITITKGDSQSIIVTLHDNATRRPTDFLPTDNVYFSVKENLNDADYVIQKHTNTFSGSKVAIILDPMDTELLEARKYYYDVELRRDTEVHTLVPVSTLMLSPQVTTRS